MCELGHGKRRATEALGKLGQLLSNVAISESDGELGFEEEQIFGENNEVEEEEEDAVHRSMDLHTKMTWL